MAIRATMLIALLACQTTPSAQPTPPQAATPQTLQTPPPEGPPSAQTAPPQDAAANGPVAPPLAITPAMSCVDNELQKQGLNKYGDPPHTMYMGGTPLFNEATGKHTDRLVYLAKHRPDIAATCKLSTADVPDPASMR